MDFEENSNKASINEITESFVDRFDSYTELNIVSTDDAITSRKQVQELFKFLLTSSELQKWLKNNPNADKERIFYKILEFESSKS